MVELPGDNFFEKIAWLEDGKGMISGWKSSPRSGNVWLRSITGNTLSEVDEEIGNERLGEIVYMGAALNNRVWLSGNTRKSNTSNRGDIWWFQIDGSGSVKQQHIEETTDFEQLFCAFTGADGKLYLGGEQYKSPFSYAQFYEVDPNGQLQSSTVLPNSVSSYIAGIHQFPDLGTKVILQSKANKYHQLRSMEEGGEASYDLKMDENSGLKAKFFTLNYNDEYLLLGDVYKGKKTPSNLHLLSYNPNPTVFAANAPISAKSFNNASILTASQPILEDENKDGELTVGERGAVTFFLGKYQ